MAKRSEKIGKEETEGMTWESKLCVVSKSNRWRGYLYVPLMRVVCSTETSAKTRLLFVH